MSFPSHFGLNEEKKEEEMRKNFIQKSFVIKVIIYVYNIMYKSFYICIHSVPGFYFCGMRVNFLGSAIELLSSQGFLQQTNIRIQYAEITILFPLQVPH